jgi:plasmid maintenance system antidote protein VapI
MGFTTPPKGTKTKNLREFLRSVGATQTEFSALVKSTPSTISKLCARSLSPSLELAVRIHAATHGQVSYEDMLATSDKEIEKRRKHTAYMEKKARKKVDSDIK